LLQTPIAIYDKAKEQRTELKLAQINLEIAEKKCHRKGAFQPT
jgi:outer membrane protein